MHFKICHFRQTGQRGRAVRACDSISFRPLQADCTSSNPLHTTELRWRSSFRCGGKLLGPFGFKGHDHEQIKKIKIDEEKGLEPQPPPILVAQAMDAMACMKWQLGRQRPAGKDFHSPTYKEYLNACNDNLAGKDQPASIRNNALHPLTDGQTDPLIEMRGRIQKSYNKTEKPMGTRLANSPPPHQLDWRFEKDGPLPCRFKYRRSVQALRFEAVTRTEFQYSPSGWKHLIIEKPINVSLWIDGPYKLKGIVLHEDGGRVVIWNIDVLGIMK